MDIELATRLGHLFLLVAGSGLLVFAAMHDIAARTIPNSASVVLALLGALLRLQDGDLVVSLMLDGIVFAVCTACWLRGWMGGGDVKLLSAAALFVPHSLVGSLLIATTLAGGLVAIVYLIARLVARHISLTVHVNPRSFPARVLRAEHWRLLRGTPLPYGSAIAAGALFVNFAG